MASRLERNRLRQRLAELEARQMSTSELCARFLGAPVEQIVVSAREKHPGLSEAADFAIQAWRDAVGLERVEENAPIPQAARNAPLNWSRTAWSLWLRRLGTGVPERLRAQLGELFAVCGELLEKRGSSPDSGAKSGVSSVSSGARGGGVSDHDEAR